LDGGSTDNTLDVLNAFGSHVRWQSRNGRGPGPTAINKASHKTHGDVLTWLNADDMFADGAMRTALAFSSSPSRRGDGVWKRRLRGLPRKIDRAVRAHCSRSIFTGYCTIPLHRATRRLLPAIGVRSCRRLDASLNWTMDYDLWLKMPRDSKVAYLPKLFAHYRWLTDNKTATGGFAGSTKISQVIRRHGGGTPAYVRLERVNLHLQQSLKSLRQWRIGSAISAPRQPRERFFARHAPSSACASRRRGASSTPARCFAPAPPEGDFSRWTETSSPAEAKDLACS